MVRTVPAEIPDLTPDVQRAHILPSPTARVLDSHTGERCTLTLQNDAVKPVAHVSWTKSAVCKPTDWYEKMEASLDQPMDSNPDMHALNIENAEQINSEFRSTEQSSGTTSKNRPSKSRTGKTDKKLNGVLRKRNPTNSGESEGELVSDGGKTFYNPLTNDELQRMALEKVAEVHKDLLQCGQQEQRSKERETYLLKNKEWIDDQIHSFHREKENCEEFLCNQLDEQETLESLTREQTENVLQRILDQRLAKAALFAEHCQKWQQNLVEKQEEIHIKLAQYHAWKAWDKTENFMRKQIKKFSAQIPREKQERYRDLRQLRQKFQELKRLWQIEHNRRMSLLDVALRKEGTVRGANHVQAKQAVSDTQRAKYNVLLKEVETWEEIKQRWSKLLEEHVSADPDLLQDLDKARLPVVYAEKVTVRSPVFQTSALCHLDQIQSNLARVTKDLDAHNKKYDIPLEKLVCMPPGALEKS
ncbi:uncharacterized protein LOC129581307 [Paramacrobiotus metropolitanus]|uniref:uncharacterized protein LOC129581307 n=1 Tax=Paramacrobiotus metropolitanus TaxID=2943436 RepID=UPI0024457CFF|nr:uncharacterized protein LOC129581307 [Paramacrobiotus metropolitanus]